MTQRHQDVLQEPRRDLLGRGDLAGAQARAVCGGQLHHRAHRVITLRRQLHRISLPGNDTARAPAVISRGSGPPDTLRRRRSAPRCFILTQQQADQFATEWYQAWNAHDIERVLSHYAEDVVFTSPFVIHGDVNLTIHGKAELVKHVRRAFERVPDLHFEPIETLVGVTGVVLYYRGIFGLKAAEVMNLNSDGQVDRVIAHYDRLPTVGAE